MATALPTGADRAGELIFDWNELNRKGTLVPRGFSLFDETLRDGLQNPSVRDPSIDDKLRILHLMEDLGIDEADIGLPGSSARAFDDVLRLCQEVAACKMKIRIATAGRTVVGDITPMIEVSQRAGIPVEVYAFIGSSPIRQYVEQWDVALIAKRSAEAIDVAVKAGLPVAYVTEDTTRSRPDVLTTLFRAAIDHGATRLCLSDTVGHATPDGVRNLIQFTRSVIAGTGATVGIDWHGHNDRGLALENAIWALELGADRVHATALGHRGARGERADRARAHEPQLARAARPPGPAGGGPPARRALGTRPRPDEAGRVLRDRGEGRRVDGAARLPARRPRRVPGRARACTQPPSSRPSRRATRGSPIASTAACPRGRSVGRKRSGSAS